MLTKKQLQQLAQQKRTIRRTQVGARFAEGDVITAEESPFGPLELLIGEWQSFPGHGWNMIALPFASKPEEHLDYRLLLNQYNEELSFTELGFPIPNRGIDKADDGHQSTETDQLVAGLKYYQKVTQIASADYPKSVMAGEPGEVIHEEPGLWLHMTNETTDNLDIARLGTVPHGDSLLALGSAKVRKGAPIIPNISGLPIGVDDNLNNRYLAPYKHFQDEPFEEVFDPVFPNQLLKTAIDNNTLDIVRTTELSVNTTVATAGIKNIPFIVKQADAAEMQFTFWIEELSDKDKFGDPLLMLQYSQTVFLEFFEQRGGKGLIRWPHVSINTLFRKDQIE